MKSDYFSKDVQEFIELLHIFKVRYVIVGGEAVIYYGYPRLTGDVDIFYERSEDNVKQLYRALNEFWQGDIPGIESENDFLEPGVIIQFGIPPNRIDLINRIDGVCFEEAWENKAIDHITINGRKINIYFIGLKQLIKNKKTVKRNKDLDDLRYLEERF